jgi:hypothetical protein
MKNYRDWQRLPLPELMQGMEKDHRGFPVPYNVARTLVDNVPRFQVNDERRTEECIEKKLCTICGNPLSRDNLWLVGGPISAFHPMGAFMDSPMHKCCLDYALQVCPYMALNTYTKKTVVDKLVPADYGYTGLIDPTMSHERVPFFAVVRVKDYEVKRRSPMHRFIKPLGPYLEVEFWRDGVKLDDEEMEIAWNNYQSTLRNGV